MRSVFLFPTGASRNDTEVRLDTLGQRRELPDQLGFEWLVDECLYVRIGTASESLYADWDTGDLMALTSATGGLPSWALIVDVSGRIPGFDEVARFLRAVMGTSGYAMDDYSNRVWTLAEIMDAEFSEHGRRFLSPA
jgi:hypothetical protein